LFQARLFDEPQLASLCLENIDKNTGDALAAEGFTDVDLGNYTLCLSLSHVVFLNNSLTDHWVSTSPSVRYIGGGVGEGYSRGEGGAFVWCFGALGRGRGSQAAAAAHTWEQTQSAGQSSHTHPLPSHDHWGVCCRWIGTQSNQQRSFTFTTAVLSAKTPTHPVFLSLILGSCLRPFQVQPSPVFWLTERWWVSSFTSLLTRSLALISLTGLAAASAGRSATSHVLDRWRAAGVTAGQATAYGEWGAAYSCFSFLPMKLVMLY